MDLEIDYKFYEEILQLLRILQRKNFFYGFYEETGRDPFITNT